MSRKSEILAELARSRAAVARDTSSVKEQFNIAARIQKSVRSRPFAWLSGAAAIGYILAGPKTRTRTVTKLVKSKPGVPIKTAKEKPRSAWGVIFSLIKLAVPLIRPALSAYAARRFGDFAERLAK